MCSVTARSSAAVAMTDGAAAQARGLLRVKACARHHRDVLEDAQLLVSELVTNAVKYGAAPVWVDVECDEQEGLRVTVSDANTAHPQQPSTEQLATGGRGLALVAALSDQWGVIDAPPGKRVWFRIRSSLDH